jgi:hypothetical protein
MSAKNGDVALVIERLKDLREDLRSNPDGWQNQTLEDYLESTQAWLEATRQQAPAEPTWEFVAGLFGVGKIYE